MSIHSVDENNFIKDTAASRMGDNKMHIWIGMSKKAFGEFLCNEYCNRLAVLTFKNK